MSLAGRLNPAQQGPPPWRTGQHQQWAKCVPNRPGPETGSATIFPNAGFADVDGGKNNRIKPIQHLPGVWHEPAMMESKADPDRHNSAGSGNPGFSGVWLRRFGHPLTPVNREGSRPFGASVAPSLTRAGQRPQRCEDARSG